MPRKGFKTITVSDETYAQLAYCALEKGKSIPKLLEHISKNGEITP